MSGYQVKFGETQNLVRESVRKFVEKEIKPYVDEWEEQEAFPLGLYEKAGEAGILGIGHPEQYGGSGTDVFTKMVATEELMRCGSGGVVASLGSLDIGLPPIWRWGSEALKENVGKKT